MLFAASGETIEEIGKSAANLMPEEARCGGDIILFRPDREFDTRYLGYLLDCPAAVNQKVSMGRGITVMHIYGTQLKRLTLPLAPLLEQIAIAHFLGNAEAAIDDGIDRAQSEIDLIGEYRNRLIADVITGKLDVREGANALPEKPGTCGATLDAADCNAANRERMEMTNWNDCPAVERRPGKVSGAWVFAGTRIPLSALYENLAG